MMRNLILRLSILTAVVLIVSFLALPEDLWAQCPMCKMSAEADLKNGGSDGKGLNSGIMYLLSLPYLLLGTITFLWYRNKMRVERYEQGRELRALLEPKEG
jgi:hypothetical protein